MLNIMKTKKFISLLILNYSYNAKSFTTIEDIESKHLLQLEQENSELIESITSLKISMIESGCL